MKPAHPIPERTPDAVCDLPTLPQAALLYRLSGDYNPLHADPAYARKAGFKMPILHGRCTFSVVGHALLKTCCAYDPARLKSMQGRFSSPVYPGETIRTDMWMDGDVVTFRATVPSRGVTVLNNGRAEISASR
jgi:acyl dehydratase